MINGIVNLINLVQFDYGQALLFTLTDVDGTVIDLTGATIKFNAQLDSDYTVQFSNSMSIVDPTLGQCQYKIQQNDFLVSGTYNAQVVVSFSSPSESFSFDGIQIVVAPKVPQS